MESKLKISFVYYDLEGELAVERLWGEREDNFFRIKNIPFFTPNISFDDLVKIEEDEDEFFFDEVIESSGNSTIQMIVYNEKDLKGITTKLEYLGCGWEGSHLQGYISVNVPKEIKYSDVKTYLDNELEYNRLDYKESCLNHIY